MDASLGNYKLAQIMLASTKSYHKDQWLLTILTQPFLVVLVSTMSTDISLLAVGCVSKYEILSQWLIILGSH